MRLGHVPFERKLVEQVLLGDAAFPIIGFTPSLNDQSESATPIPRNTYFFNGIAPTQSSRFTPENA